MTVTSTERVLVIPAQLFRDFGYFQGFSAVTPEWEALLSGPQASYQPRSEMESDPNFKQIIPYVIFRHRDVEGGTSLFQYRRGSGQGESRLHDKISIGVGGHISHDDQRGSGWETYEEALRRELAEEVDIESDYSSQLLGMINDDETDVGRVHLGVVHVYDVTQPRVKPREASLQDGGFVPLGAIADGGRRDGELVPNLHGSAVFRVMLNSCESYLPRSSRDDAPGPARHHRRHAGDGGTAG